MKDLLAELRLRGYSDATQDAYIRYNKLFLDEFDEASSTTI